VSSPASLADWVHDELAGAREQYLSGGFEHDADEEHQPALPWSEI